MLMKPSREVGIVGYGAYVPRYRLPATEIDRVWTDGYGGTPGYGDHVHRGRAQCAATRGD